MKISPKYRVLANDELVEFEKEFVDFLVLNGVTADMWVKLKEDDKPSAEDMITLFSDVVMEGVLRKIQFLEYRTSQDIKTFQCLESTMVLVGIKTSNTNHDFLDQLFLENSITNPPEGIQVYTTSKKYTTERQLELFKMIQSGSKISDGSLFKALSLAL